MWLLESLLLFSILRTHDGVFERGERLRSTGQVPPQAVVVRVGYYLNDRLHRAQDECQLYILADSDVVAPVKRQGNAWSYVPRTGQQTLVLTCGGYFVMTPLELDLFAGGTLVLGVITEPERMSVEWAPRMPVPADDNYDIVTAYEDARPGLRRRWLRLPGVVRSEVKSAYVIVFGQSSSGGDARLQCFAAGFR